ncbi:leader peptidase (prepilin peptidase) / N-methyltransferase [Pollutimonas bauzanensis]|uniref:Leader peptidase (Prepilin peptidase) / N-methyltransferase n=2 Tax=Pollutimonas bauzanensis TaxID=658167 RepID=A0A1M5R746_9BURK|nr:leader peptidase (prepilin peptidase) / N-methyltransferase [Pollutimonas bauzanensis]
MLPPLAAGAAAGVCCARAARGYGAALDAGGEPDAACMRAAWLHALGLSRPASTASTASGVAAPRPALPAPRESAGLDAACAVLMAACFAAMHGLHGGTLRFLALAMAGVLLLTLALIDARKRLLPDALTLPLLWLGLGLAWAGQGPALRDAVAGAMLGYGFLWLLSRLFSCLSRREGMGHGDVKLLAALGAWLGWRPLAMVLLAACLAGLLFAMAHQRRLRPAGAYPFGPFLAASGMAALMAGSEVHWHFC